MTDNNDDFEGFPDDFEFPADNDDTPREEPQIYFSDDLITIYTAFCNQVFNPQSVLYPSCGFDASPVKVFDDVTFVDIEKGSEGCVKKLQEAGFQALKQDIKTYSPQDLHDLLILLNPAIPTEWASRHLKPGGYILANDYHGNASEMYEQPNQFTLWGSIDFVEKDRRKNDNRVVVSRNLEDLFQPMKDAAEFERLKPTEFKFTRDLVLSYVDQGVLRADPNDSFEKKWAAYREVMREGMPDRRVADRYIFVKN
ncbi:hypothetical protein HOE37_04030 [Candidatus Woesearchaeota archaeon]|jgi:hypothetical protein|nr:hypothetical protein [Candidatus Woesearchaeota archaeon]MBT4111001.1 hypothetical protein [Candidatus Woesearchaeota archaeon]MBT4336870.1 hypothetical protein [Candidatus Woesearchaeota archaeon]MBT4469815.1 hypothetical protein [Candidatus Woesearchaeota archaeon]MBT6743714.1 hypothetical protein [Candidatus Woesearchaeota archaeon]